MIAASGVHIKPDNPTSWTELRCKVQDNSRIVSSNQSAPHPNLIPLVRKHLSTQHREPPREHNLQAYKRLRAELEKTGCKLVLDSFCGTGQSTAALAEVHPDCLVVGIDQSVKRLARHPKAKTENYMLLQANCEAIWSLLAENEQELEAHYLLYPNPWPKKAQLKRRIHGHPGFADLIKLGGAIELRSNWGLYVEEFAIAMEVAGALGEVTALADTIEPLTLFERKYLGSGQQLWRYHTTPTP